MASAGRRDDRSAEALEYRRLYKTRRWQRTRKDQLSAHPLCAMCQEGGRVTPATICNHVDKKSKQTEKGFFAGPFNSLCATHHDSTQQRVESREARGMNPQQAFGADGWPL
ncbi:hypothetical protein [Brevundimonas sp.]|uniref:hypothetical protein n=1 Tax=Brevundimonas sp. TaxID=1871086 RepID=UPI0039188123